MTKHLPVNWSAAVSGKTGFDNDAYMVSLHEMSTTTNGEWLTADRGYFLTEMPQWTRTFTLKGRPDRIAKSMAFKRLGI